MITGAPGASFRLVQSTSLRAGSWTVVPGYCTITTSGTPTKRECSFASKKTELLLTDLGHFGAFVRVCILTANRQASIRLPGFASPFQAISNAVP